MKKAVGILLFMVCLFGAFAQVSPSQIVRVTSATTPFAENIPAGENIVVAATGKQYLVKKAIVSTKSVATCDTSELKELTIAAGTIAQYWRGDKTWQTFPTALSSFTNDLGFITSDTKWDGGTTGLNAATGRTSLGLGNSATKDTGTSSGTVATGDHNHTGVYEVPLTFSTGLTRTGNTITASGSGVSLDSIPWQHKTSGVTILRNTNDAILATGTTGSGYTEPYPARGGAMMLWYPRKAAFVAGFDQQQSWTNNSIGLYSFAGGYNASASGEGAVAFCRGTASGQYSIAMGAGFAIGIQSTAFGGTARGDGSSTFNTGETTGTYASAFGLSKSDSYCSLSIGQYNIGGGTTGSWVSTDPAFEIGNGTSGVHANAFQVLKDGTTTAAGAFYGTNFILSSDIRLKKNIRPLNFTGIEKIQWKNFSMKSDSTNRNRAGVIAQEVEKVLPEFVHTDKQGIKSVAYIDLLVTKIAQMDSVINSLQNRIKQLENNNNQPLPSIILTSQK